MKVLSPIELLNLASAKLGQLHSQVVFLGGAIVPLLVTDQGSKAPRVTTDVDVVIEIGSRYIDAVNLDQRLRSLGFENVIDGPTCRYISGSLIMDVVPVNPRDTTGANRWYSKALECAWPHMLSSGLSIHVIDPVCFLATKLTAFRSPSRENNNDIFLSRDFEDIVRVVDGRDSLLDEVDRSEPALQEFLRTEFFAILAMNYVEEALEGHVEPGRAPIVVQRLRAMAKSVGQSALNRVPKII